ncbi:MAG: choline dehydrogenase, partial [Chloroflexi bacterium]|nr:choline dehydrogenase [Chloroflexota bacterium]
LREGARRASGSGYHPCGTAPMGAADDSAAVVDQYGRVFGVEGLFVADASIMPTIPRANTNIPTIMIGERFGEWLREDAI